MGAASQRRVDPARTSNPVDPAKLRDLTMEFMASALAFTPAGRVESIGRQFLSRGFVGDDDPEVAAATIVFTMSLAADLAVFAPSPSGSTAVDRYLRKTPPAGSDEAQAARALSRAAFRIIRVETRAEPGAFDVTDLATHERLRLFQDKVPTNFIGATVATRLCPLENGGFIATGPALPLDSAGIEVARGFLRPNGRGLTNGERCAEAVYRHAIRHGDVPDDLLDALAEESEEPAEFPFGPDSNPMSALAHRWAELAPGAEPAPDDLVEARKLSSPQHLIGCIAMAGIAADHKKLRLAEAFDRVATLQIDTIRRRQAVSAVAHSLDDVARLIDQGIAQRELSPADRARFADLRRRAGAADGAGKRSDVDLDRLLQVIKGLRAKTVDQGCTEAEAIAAAAKVAELLDRYGLSLSDVELRKQVCAGVGIETTRRRSGPLDHTVPGIARFFACRSWTETTQAETIRHIFFGLPGDVEAAEYLYELVERTFETETLTFKRGDFYRNLCSSERRSGTNSFQLGLARGINDKLDTLREEREAALHRSSGRDLMMVKGSVVDDEMEKLGLAFTYRSASGKKFVLTDAYAAGQEAGARFDYRPGIGQ
jgi:hypothetical protein